MVRIVKIKYDVWLTKTIPHSLFVLCFCGRLSKGWSQKGALLLWHYCYSTTRLFQHSPSKFPIFLQLSYGFGGLTSDFCTHIIKNYLFIFTIINMYYFFMVTKMHKKILVIIFFSSLWSVWIELKWLFSAQISFVLFYFILVPVFQVVRFPNDACEISGGSYNGTCYTALVFFKLIPWYPW